MNERSHSARHSDRHLEHKLNNVIERLRAIDERLCTMAKTFAEAMTEVQDAARESKSQSDSIQAYLRTLAAKVEELKTEIKGINQAGIDALSSISESLRSEAKESADAILENTPAETPPEPPPVTPAP